MKIESKGVEWCKTRRLVSKAVFVGLTLVTPFAHPADKPGAKDFPAISRFKGAEIVEYQAADFDEVLLPIKPMPEEPAPPAALVKAQGRVTSIMYAVPAGKTPLEVMRNYEQALGGSYKTVFNCAGNDCGQHLASYIANHVVPSGWGHMSFETDKNRYVLARRSSPEGEVYLMLYAMQETNYPATLLQRTVELKPMQADQVTVLDAAALQRGLEAEGKIAIYGVLFDTARADIKPASKASLDEMAKLLVASPALKVYIVGHTDNVGGLADNLALSQRRAEAVSQALVSSYRVDPRRLVARGVASLAPITSNAAEAGRARNRRVELVVQ